MPEIKTLWAAGSIWTSCREGCDIEWIAVHYTATQASAYDNAVYFSRGGNGESSAHYFVDGGGVIYNSVPDDSTAWAVGNWYMNLRTLSIEVVSDGRDFTDAEIDDLTWLVARKMEEYGVDEEHVIRHYDVADYAVGEIVDPYKHCPAPYVNRAKWNELHEKITGGDMAKYPGRTVDVYDANGTAAQKWKLEKIGDFYRIRSTTGSKDKVLDVYAGEAVHTGSVQIFPANDTDAQLWTFEKCGGAWSGYYYIHPKKNAKVSIDVYNGDTSNLNRIWLYENNESAAQKWAVLPNEDGTVTFISGKGSHPAMDVYDGGRPF